MGAGWQWSGSNGVAFFSWKNGTAYIVGHGGEDDLERQAKKLALTEGKNSQYEYEISQ